MTKLTKNETGQFLTGKVDLIGGFSGSDEMLRGLSSEKERVIRFREEMLDNATVTAYLSFLDGCLDFFAKHKGEASESIGRVLEEHCGCAKDACADTDNLKAGQIMKDLEFAREEHEKRLFDLKKNYSDKVAYFTFEIKGLIEALDEQKKEISRVKAAAFQQRSLQKSKVTGYEKLIVELKEKLDKYEESVKLSEKGGKDDRVLVALKEMLSTIDENGRATRLLEERERLCNERILEYDSRVIDLEKKNQITFLKVKRIREILIQKTACFDQIISALRVKDSEKVTEFPSENNWQIFQISELEEKNKDLSNRLSEIEGILEDRTRRLNDIIETLRFQNSEKCGRVENLQHRIEMLAKEHASIIKKMEETILRLNDRIRRQSENIDKKNIRISELKTPWIVRKFKIFSRIFVKKDANKGGL